MCLWNLYRSLLTKVPTFFVYRRNDLGAYNGIFSVYVAFLSDLLIRYGVLLVKDPMPIGVGMDEYLEFGMNYAFISSIISFARLYVAQNIGSACLDTPHSEGESIRDRSNNSLLIVWASLDMAITKQLFLFRVRY